MIALLCPSKGRPEKLARMIKSALDTSTCKLNFYIGLSIEDYDKYGFANFQNDRVDCFVKADFPELLPTAHKWNILADIARNDPLTLQSYGYKGTDANNSLFMIAGDDMFFDTPGWDKAIIDHYEKLSNKIHVYNLQDSRDKDGVPHPIVTREYIEAMGYIYPPIFLHWQGDIWTNRIARYNYCFTHLRDYLLIHDKPSDKGQPDATHTGIRSYGWLQRDQWVHERCKNTLLVNECQRLRSLMRK